MNNFRLDQAALGGQKMPRGRLAEWRRRLMVLQTEPTRFVLGAMASPAAQGAKLTVPPTSQDFRFPSILFSNEVKGRRLSFERIRRFRLPAFDRRTDETRP